MIVPLGHHFFPPSTRQSTWPLYILCLTPAAAVTSPEQNALLPKATFLCAQNLGKLILGEQPQDSQASTPAEAHNISKAETNYSGTSASLKLK